MKCSECSNEVKPIVAIDIDGTLGDYHGHFLRFLESYYYKSSPGERYDGNGKFSFWCMNAYDISLEEYRTVKLAYRQGGMKRTMPIFPGARALCWAVRDADAELWLTTTRPYLSLDGVVPDTVAWLDHWEIEYDGLLFDDDKYQALAERVDRERVIAILDDQVDQLTNARMVFAPDVPILVRGAYNFKQRGLVMADLDACTEIIFNRLENWRRAYA